MSFWGRNGDTLGVTLKSYRFALSIAFLTGARHDEMGPSSLRRKSNRSPLTWNLTWDIVFYSWASGGHPEVAESDTLDRICDTLSFLMSEYVDFLFSSDKIHRDLCKANLYARSIRGSWILWPFLCWAYEKVKPCFSFFLRVSMDGFLSYLLFAFLIYWSIFLGFC